VPFFIEAILTMKTSKEAVQIAVDYLTSLPKALLGSDPDAPRLEAVSRVDDHWSVLLSYLDRPKNTTDSVGNVLLNALRSYRIFKEIIVDAATGEVLSFAEPRTNSRTGT
jgi:hypothetical protein